MSAIEGKDSASAELVKSLAQKILAHRLIVRENVALEQGNLD